MSEASASRRSEVRSAALSRRGLLAASLSGVAGFLLTGCPSAPSTAPGTPGSSGAGSGKLSIVTTTGMVTDLVRAIAGDHANVVGLMNEGVDPHLYKPTVADTGLLLKADVIIYSGLHLEGRMEEAFAQAARRGIQVIAATAGLSKEDVIHPAEGHPDPHVWGDAALWGKCSQHVADDLSKIDASHAADYAERAKDYRTRLDALHQYGIKSIASIPEGQRHLVTAHDAFSYFSRAYGIPVRSVQGITTDSEPGVKDIVELRKFLVEKKIPALFTESSVNERMLQAVIEGAREDGWTVKVSGTLYSDAMGKADTYEGTFEGMFDHNVTTITRALGGEAPAKGLSGKLTGEPR